MNDYAAVAPIFLFISSVLIVGYLGPFVLGKLDDRKVEHLKNSVAARKKYKCKCGTMLTNHFCSGCSILNKAEIQAYFLTCDDHPSLRILD